MGCYLISLLGRVVDGCLDVSVYIILLCLCNVRCTCGFSLKFITLSVELFGIVLDFLCAMIM